MTQDDPPAQKAPASAIPRAASGAAKEAPRHALAPGCAQLPRKEPESAEQLRWIQLLPTPGLSRWGSYNLFLQSMFSSLFIRSLVSPHNNISLTKNKKNPH